MTRGWVFAVVCLGGALSFAVPARALNFFELSVYPATTEGKGLHEIESLSTFVANGRAPSEEEEEGEEARRHHLFRTSLEYNYGVTDKIDLAAYLDLQWPSGADPEYAGVRFRGRGALWDKGRFPIDLGWYFEVEVPEEEETQLELEFRPLLSRDFGRFSLDVNPIFDLPTVSDERRTLEFGYATRVYYRFSADLQAAVEFFGDIGEIRDVDPSQEQEHYVLPAIYGRIVPGFKIAAGPAFGLTRASDPVILKLVLEYEFS